MSRKVKKCSSPLRSERRSGGGLLPAGFMGFLLKNGGDFAHRCCLSSRRIDETLRLVACRFHGVSAEERRPLCASLLLSFLKNGDHSAHRCLPVSSKNGDHPAHHSCRNQRRTETTLRIIPAGFIEERRTLCASSCRRSTRRTETTLRRGVTTRAACRYIPPG